MTLDLSMAMLMMVKELMKAATEGMVLTSLKRGKNVVIINIFYLERFFKGRLFLFK